MGLALGDVEGDAEGLAVGLALGDEDGASLGHWFLLSSVWQVAPPLLKSNMYLFAWVS